MSDVLLGSYFGGLGDNLQFSSLPEEFSKQQGRDTYIVSETTFLSNLNIVYLYHVISLE